MASKPSKASRPPGGHSAAREAPREPRATGPTPQELGDDVRAARERAGLSLEQVSTATRIRASVIRNIESGDFAPCGGAVYARGHLRSIANSTGGDGQVWVDDYDRMAGALPVAGVVPTNVDAINGVDRAPWGAGISAPLSNVGTLPSQPAPVSRTPVNRRTTPPPERAQPYVPEPYVPPAPEPLVPAAQAPAPAAPAPVSAPAARTRAVPPVRPAPAQPAAAAPARTPAQAAARAEPAAPVAATVPVAERAAPPVEPPPRTPADPAEEPAAARTGVLPKVVATDPLAGAAGSSGSGGSGPVLNRDLEGRRRPGAVVLMTAAAAAVVLIAALILVLPGHTHHGSGSKIVTQPAVPKVSSPAPTPTAPAPTPSVTPTVAPGVTVLVRVKDAASWIHVVNSTGALLFQGVVPPGTSKPFHATQALHFVFGFGPAIDLTVNGKDIGTPAYTKSKIATVVFTAST